MGPLIFFLPFRQTPGLDNETRSMDGIFRSPKASDRRRRRRNRKFLSFLLRYLTVLSFSSNRNNGKREGEEGRKEFDRLQKKIFFFSIGQPRYWKEFSQIKTFLSRSQHNFPFRKKKMRKRQSRLDKHSLCSYQFRHLLCGSSNPAAPFHLQQIHLFFFQWKFLFFSLS